MTLKLYHQKRHFNKTSEPKGKSKTTRKKNLYIIQKHAASHLHYDFRLELNGVLLSWAVPKGPSLDPSVKRLAIHVEDHPLEYGNFEGIIPKGQYGGGTVMLWDKGLWFPETTNVMEDYHKGDLTFTLKAKKLNGKWKLIRMNKNDKTWLLIKVKDEFAKSSKKYDILVDEPNSVLSNLSIDEITQHYENLSVKKKVKRRKKFSLIINLPSKKFPNIIHPQLATLVDQPPTGNNWLHEIKFDGYRLIAFKNETHVQLFTRNNHNWTNKFTTIEKEIEKISASHLIIDGEVVALDEHQHSNFQLLQNAIKNHATDFYYYVFDILYYEKYDLTSLPLLERKKILKEILESLNSDIIRYSDHVIGNGKKIFKKSYALQLEGIVSKEVTSIYSQRRDLTWLKTKCIKRQEFVIGGFTHSQRRPYFRSLMLGTYNQNGELIYHGNVGTGFTETSLTSIYDLLSKHISKTMTFKARPAGSNDAVWLKPIIVAEIEFTEWTDTGTLRHPSFKGIRTDKSAKCITRESEVKITQTNVPTNRKKKIVNPYRLTHPEKLVFPEDKISKLEVAEYYDKIQQWILPYVSNRPLTLVRCPTDYHHCFYQKHLDKNVPTGLHQIMIESTDGDDSYIYLNDKKGLIALPQMGVLELHTWASHIDDVEYPDMLIFDLDPAPEVSWKRVIKAAFVIKELLAEFNLTCFVKTTGGKGLHVVVPIKPEYQWSDIKKFTQGIADYLVANNNKEYTSNMSKAARKNKIFIDYLRNQRGATAIAPYSTRARIHAPISTPVAWDELTSDIRDTFFTLKTVLTRLDTIKMDPWKDFFKTKQQLKPKKIT